MVFPATIGLHSRAVRAERTGVGKHQPLQGLPSAQLDQEYDPGPLLHIERQVDEGGDAHQVEASGRDVTARDSDCFDGLVDGARPAA